MVSVQVVHTYNILNE